MLLFISSSSPVDFLFSFPSDTWPALRVMMNRKTHLDLGAPRPAHLGHMATELLLAPCSWFPPFGNKLVEMCPQVSCSPGVLQQQCWDLCSPQTTLPWIPHTSLHRTSSQVVCTISGWCGLHQELLGQQPLLWGDYVMASRDRAWCPGPPPKALVPGVHTSGQAGFISSFDPKVLRRAISPHFGGVVWFPCGAAFTCHVWVRCVSV